MQIDKNHEKHDENHLLIYFLPFSVRFHWNIVKIYHTCLFTNFSPFLSVCLMFGGLIRFAWWFFLWLMWVCVCWCLDDTFSNRNGNDGNRYQCLYQFVSAMDNGSSNANHKTPTKRSLQKNGQTIFNSNKSSLKLFFEEEKSRAR